MKKNLDALSKAEQGWAKPSKLSTATQSKAQGKESSNIGRLDQGGVEPAFQVWSLGLSYMILGSTLLVA